MATGDSTVVVPYCLLTKIDAATPIAIPRVPPEMHSTSASTRNCSMMVSLVAPSALRMPISLVRSVTDTSMMFMMPMPPTSSDTAAIPSRSVENVCAVCA